MCACVQQTLSFFLFMCGCFFFVDLQSLCVWCKDVKSKVHLFARTCVVNFLFFLLFAFFSHACLCVLLNGVAPSNDGARVCLQEIMWKSRCRSIPFLVSAPTMRQRTGSTVNKCRILCIVSFFRSLFFFLRPAVFTVACQSSHVQRCERCSNGMYVQRRRPSRKRVGSISSYRSVSPVSLKRKRSLHKKYNTQERGEREAGKK